MNEGHLKNMQFGGDLKLLRYSFSLPSISFKDHCVRHTVDKTPSEEQGRYLLLERLYWKKLLSYNGVPSQ